jgi:hypothetical protein
MDDAMEYPLLVLVLSFLALWLSAWFGASFLRRRRNLEEEIRDDFGVVLAAALTLLGLIIGFSFSMATSRYDQRKNYEEAEANAIGTEYVRTDLLPAADAAKVRALLRSYSISVFCSMSAAMSRSFGRSMPVLPNCRPSCGPQSRLRLQPSRHPLSPWPCRV